MTTVNGFISTAGIPPRAWDGKEAFGQDRGAVRGRGEQGQGSGLGGPAGPHAPHTASICSSSPSTASVWWNAAWEPMTTRVAPAGRWAAQGLAPSPAPHRPARPPGACTHPGPRRRQNRHRPARRRERRRPQPEHTDGLGLPLGLGGRQHWGSSNTHALSPRNP